MCCQRAGLDIQAVAISSIGALNAWQSQRPRRDLPAGVLLNLVSDQFVEWILWTPISLQVIPVTTTSPQTVWQELATSWRALRGQLTDLPKSLLVIGSAAAIPKLQEIFTAQVGLPVEAFDASRVVGAEASRLEHQEQVVAALGLALQGLGLARVPLNLIASFQSEARSRQVRRTATTISAICAVAIVLLGVRGMLELRHRSVLVRESLEQQERLYQTLRPEIRSLLQRQQRTQQRSVQLERLVTEAPLLTQVLAQVAEVLPDAVWLTKLECLKNASLEGLLEGRAKSFQNLAQFMDALKSGAEMTTVKLLSNTVMKDEASGKELIAFAVQVQRQRTASATAAASESGVAKSAQRQP